MNSIIKIFFIIFAFAMSCELFAIANNSIYLYDSYQSRAGISSISFSTDKSNGTKVATTSKKQNMQVAKPDTTNSNKIVKVWEDSEGILNVLAELADAQSEVKLSIFNMLGKEVKRIYSGVPPKKNEDGHHYFSSETALNVPKSVYILVIQGSNFRIAEKFIVTKS